MTEMNNGETTEEEMYRQSVTAFHIAKLQAEVERLNKALEQLREIVDKRYDDCMDVDATDDKCVSGLVWEDGLQVTWTEEAPELAAWLKENRS